MYFFGLIRVDVLKFRHLAQLNRFVHPFEEKLMIARLGAQDETQIELLQIPDMRAIAAQAIFHHDHLQVRVLPAKFFEETASGIALAIVFLCSVLSGDHFREDGDDLLVVRVHKGGGIHLLVIQGIAVLVFLAHAIIG